MFNFQSTLLNLMKSIQWYQDNYIWKQDLEKQQLHKIQQEFQNTIQDFHTLKHAYQDDHETWRALLMKEIQQLRKESDALPRTYSRTDQFGSGKKSLLKQQLTTSIDPLKIRVLNIINGADKWIEKYSQLINVKPEMEEQISEDDILTLERLVEVCRSEREHSLSLSNSIDTLFNSQVTWIIDYMMTLQQLDKILDQIVSLMRRYEDKIQHILEQERTSSSDISQCKKLDFDEERPRKSIELYKDRKPSYQSGRTGSETCIPCNIF